MTLCIIQMMVCCGVYAYSLNEIGSIFQDFGRLESQIKTNMMVINGFMNSKRVNKNLQYQVREYLDYYMREKQERDHTAENKIISILSLNLQSKPPKGEKIY